MHLSQFIVTCQSKLVQELGGVDYKIIHELYR